MCRDLKKEVDELRQGLEAEFKVARPTEDFRASMILTTVRMRVLAEQFKKSQNPKERRELINEYEKQRGSIEKGIQMLQQSRRMGSSRAIFQSGNLS